MTARRHPFFTSARGRLLSFNLLMGVVTLLVSGVAVFGFHHASQLQEQVQRQTLNDMRGSMDLARDTANVATAAVRLSQVVGALEYKSEAERLLATQQALKHSLAQLAAADPEPGDDRRANLTDALDSTPAALYCCRPKVPA